MRRRMLVLLLAASCSAGCAGSAVDRTDEDARRATTDLPPRDTVLGVAHDLVERASPQTPAVLRLQEYDETGEGALVVRFGSPATTGVFTGSDGERACYEVAVAKGQRPGEARRRKCPPGEPLVLPPDPSRALPPALVTRLEQALRDLPSRPTGPDVVAALQGLFAGDSRSALFEVRGKHVAVSVYVGGGNPCLLTVRRAGAVSSRTQPPSAGCTPSDALEDERAPVELTCRGPTGAAAPAPAPMSRFGQAHRAQPTRHPP